MSGRRSSFPSALRGWVKDIKLPGFTGALQFLSAPWVWTYRFSPVCFRNFLFRKIRLLLPYVFVVSMAQPAGSFIPTGVAG